MANRKHGIAVCSCRLIHDAMAYLGIVPDYAATTDGLRINDVNADSPAAKGGLKAGDVIVKIGDVPVANIQGLAAGLVSWLIQLYRNIQYP